MNSWIASIPSLLRLLHPKVLLGDFIIVERNGGLGDVLCILPALAALRASEPSRRLIFITALNCVPLAKLANVADAVIPSCTRGLTWIRKRLYPYLNLIPLLPEERGETSILKPAHLMADFGNVLGVPNANYRYPRLIAPKQDAEFVTRLLPESEAEKQLLVIIHTGPTWQVKQWPLDQWQLLTSRLQSELGFRVIQSGHDGYDKRPTARAERVAAATDWVGTLTLMQVLALLQRASLFIGVDSGLLHLAHIAGIPAIGLFGPTDPQRIQPAAEKNMNLRAEVPCIGCHHSGLSPLHWKENCPHERRCMSELSVDAVLEQVRRVLKTIS